MEDNLYINSSHYRLFTYTAQQLTDIRHETNRTTAERLREDTRRALASGDAVPATAVGTPNDSEAGSVNSGNGVNNGSFGASVAAGAGEMECLTAEEELKIVAYYAIRLLLLAQHFEFPSAVKATALTYYHRFFLNTSPMTLHPKKLLSPVLYLATKTENNYISIKNFIEKAAEASLKITKEDLLAPELTIAMGLKWSFQVWHPLRGLDGIFLELDTIAAGTYVPPSGEEGVVDVGNLRERLVTLSPKTVLLTDVYFLYTPPQICLAAIWSVDWELAEFLVDVKLPASIPALAKPRKKLLDTIRECAEYHLLGTKTFETPGLVLNTTQYGIATRMAGAADTDIKKEATRIDKKLYHLNAPLKKAGGNKREPGTEELDRQIKKRKLEKEKGEVDGAIFGSEISGNGGSGAEVAK